MKRACLAGGSIETTHAGGTTDPRIASTYPVNPATAAKNPVTRSNLEIGRNSWLESILLWGPTLAATASSTPREAPIHQEAMTPQPSASNVGDDGENTGG